VRSDRHIAGVVAELKAKSEFAELGSVVSTPESEARYDFIADVDGKLKKIQCKSAYHTDGYTKVDLRCNNGDRRRAYNSDEIDAFCIYNPEVDECYLLWIGEAPNTEAERKLSSWRNHLVKDKVDT
jgi:hypothetical protein